MNFRRGFCTSVLFILIAMATSVGKNQPGETTRSACLQCLFAIMPMCTPKICDKALVFSLFQLKKRKLDETNTGNIN